MRAGISRLSTAVAVAGVAFLIAGYPAKVQAQTIFCPPGLSSGVNGSCVNLNSGQGAFSGAAVASQALSELSETSTQETTKTVTKAVAERREAEKERCAEGFRRLDGECQPIKRPEQEEKIAAEAKPAPERKLKKTEKAKEKAVKPEEEEVPAAKAARCEKPQPELQPAGAPPPVMVCKDGPCAPIPIEPAVRMGLGHRSMAIIKKGTRRDPAS
jgi:outer membrane biosynthesis protein TonB